MADRRHGRHRRYRPNSISRASLTVTAGGAGLALPLLGSSIAHAAPTETTHERPRHEAAKAPTAPTAPTAPDAPDTPDEPRVAAQTAGTAERAAPYVVTAGDTLSGIAAEERVRGGWTALYERNRRTVGRDPDLIHPGQKLTLRGTTKAAPPQRKPARSDPAPSKPAPSKPAPTKPAPTKPAPTKPAPTQKPTPPKSDPTPAAAPNYAAPVTSTRVGTSYRAQGSGWSSGYHTGVDFPVPTGTGIRAAGSGKVVSAGWGGAYGYEVVIRHKDGKYSQYAHLSAVTVRTGQAVNAGQRIGRSGSTGNSTGPHLHFEIRNGPGYGSDIDPLRYLRGKGVKI